MRRRVYQGRPPGGGRLHRVTICRAVSRSQSSGLGAGMGKMPSWEIPGEA